MRVKNLLSAAIFSILSANAMALVDRDSDGLIEINNLDDLNEMRNDLYGKSLRGDSSGCPEDTGCFGYELTRDLDFDTNKNGEIDSGDWNSGQPWVSIAGTSRDLVSAFNAKFNGNFHTIRNLRIATTSDSYWSYGFIGKAYNTDIRNIGLIDAVINIETPDAPPTRSVGVLVGNAMSTSISNSYSTNVVITADSNIDAGGLIGVAQRNSVIKDCHSTNTIINATGDSVAGGLIGYAVETLISDSHSEGSVEGGVVGGLVGTVNSTGVNNAYSNVTVTGNIVGGLIGEWMHLLEVDDTYTRIENTYALGNVTTSANVFYGGLVGRISISAGKTVSLKNSYSKNLIQANGNNYANLVGQGFDSDIVFVDSYWVKDPEGLVLEAGNTSFTEGGVLLSEIQCANNAGDNNCPRPELFANWDAVVWDFGSSTELPALKLKSNFPWMSTDRPSENGDYESFAKMKDKNPNYVCDNPTAFYAKEKNTGYVFNAKTPEVFKSFYAPGGFVCKNSQQADGSCSNFEVSFLCKSSSEVYWSSWESNDRPNDGSSGDYESYDDQCDSLTPVGIRVRKLNKTSIYYGAPQKLAAFNMTKGLTCLNDDTNCKDYEVRMTCEVIGDRE